MVPRGPDDAGTAHRQGERRSVVLSTRRLAIVDLSEAGHQPMVDPDRQTVIAFNGMIYNHRDLRSELEARGERFTSHSDTEVILRAYGSFGEDCVSRLQGMFAFAIWDPQTESILLARDRLGIKPLYYHRENGRVLFASQVKALLASGAIPIRLDPRRSRELSDLGGGRGARTPSSPAFVHCRPDTPRGLRARECTSRSIGRPAMALPLGNFPHPQAQQELRKRLQDAVRIVNSGAMLRWGCFSPGASIRRSWRQRHSREVPTRAVSVTFSEPALNEERFARAVAKRFSLRHEVVRLKSEDLLGDFPRRFRRDGSAVFRRNQHIRSLAGGIRSGPQGGAIGARGRRAIRWIRVCDAHASNESGA